MTSPIPQVVDTLAGRTSTAPFITVNFPRSPTVRDMNYKTGQRWIDTSAQNAEWYLLDFLAAEGVVNANWVQLGSGSATTESVSGNTGDVVSPDVDNNIFILGNEPSGITTDGDLSNTLTLSLENIPNSSLTHSSITLVAGSGISITTSPVSLGGSTTISATAPTTPVLTLSDDVSTSITPGTGNIQLVGHINEFGGAKFSTVVAGTHLANINPMSSYRWIVDPLGFNGTHTTISAALASATSGDTIYVMDGTYTENLTLKQGVNLVSMGSFGASATLAHNNVTVIGLLSDGGVVNSCAFTGMQFETNGNYLCSLTGATTVSFYGCQLYALDHDMFNLTNAGATISLKSCVGNISATGISLYDMTAGRLIMYEFNLTNLGGSTTLPTATAGSITIENSLFLCPLGYSGTTSFVMNNSIVNTASTNTLSITANGTGDFQIYNSSISSGTASCITVGTGVTAIVSANTLSSTNTNVLTGTGTVNTGGNVCTSSSGNNVSTINHLTVI